MGEFSIFHWLVVLAIVLIFFDCFYFVDQLCGRRSVQRSDVLLCGVGGECGERKRKFDGSQCHGGVVPA